VPRCGASSAVPPARVLPAMPVLWGDGGLRELSVRRGLPAVRGQLSSWGAEWDRL